MRGAIRLALCLLGLPQARADDGRRSRLLVAYVAGRDAVSEKRIGPVLDIWRGMHREYPRWSLRCLLVTGGERLLDRRREEQLLGERRAAAPLRVEEREDDVLLGGARSGTADEGAGVVLHCARRRR